MEQTHHLFGGVLTGPGSHQRVQRVGVAVAGFRGGELRLLAPGRVADGVGEGEPFVLSEDGDGNPKFVAATSVGAVGRGGGVGEAVAAALDCVAIFVDGELQEQRAEQGGHSLELREVHHLAPAGAGAVQQG